MQIEGVEIKPIKDVNLTFADKWIINELNKTIDAVDKKFEKYDIGMAASDLNDFFWNKFCDWYIELSKCDMQSNKEGTCATLVHVLTQTLKLLHPFIPFVTEKIYLELPNHDESIMISNWPEKTEMYEDAEYIDEVMNVIKTIRNARAEKKVPDNKKINCEIVLKNNKEIYSECVKYISKLALTSDINVLNSDGELKDNSVVLNFNDMIVNLPLDGMVDLTQEKERVEKEIARLKSEIERSEKMLSNEGFVAKAPAKLIDAEKEKLEKNKALLADLTK
jgi:valyl-tRNA synthetase